MDILWLVFLATVAVTTAAPIENPLQIVILGNAPLMRSARQTGPHRPLEVDQAGTNGMGVSKIESRHLESKTGNVLRMELILDNTRVGAPPFPQRHGNSRKRRQLEQDNVEDKTYSKFMEESMTNSEGMRVTRHFPASPQEPEPVPGKLHGEINFLLCGKRSCPNNETNIITSLVRHKRAPMSWQKHADMLGYMYGNRRTIRARKAKIVKRSVHPEDKGKKDGKHGGSVHGKKDVTSTTPGDPPHDHRRAQTAIPRVEIETTEKVGNHPPQKGIVIHDDLKRSEWDRLLKYYDDLYQDEQQTTPYYDYLDFFLSTTKTPQSTRKIAHSTTKTPLSTTKTPLSTTKTPQSTTKTPQSTRKIAQLTTKTTTLTNKPNSSILYHEMGHHSGFKQNEEVTIPAVQSHINIILGGSKFSDPDRKRHTQVQIVIDT